MNKKTRIQGILIGCALCLIPILLLAQEGQSKYERIVNLEERVNKVEIELAKIKSKMTSIEWPSN